MFLLFQGACILCGKSLFKHNLHCKSHVDSMKTNAFPDRKRGEALNNNLPPPEKEQLI